MITEESIRERLAADKVKPSRLPTWEEIEWLLSELDRMRALVAEAWDKGWGAGIESLLVDGVNPYRAALASADNEKGTDHAE